MELGVDRVPRLVAAGPRRLDELGLCGDPAIASRRLISGDHRVPTLDPGHRATGDVDGDRRPARRGTRSPHAAAAGLADDVGDRSGRLDRETRRRGRARYRARRARRRARDPDTYSSVSRTSITLAPACRAAANVSTRLFLDAHAGHATCSFTWCDQVVGGVDVAGRRSPTRPPRTRRRPSTARWTARSPAANRRTSAAAADGHHSAQSGSARSERAITTSRSRRSRCARSRSTVAASSHGRSVASTTAGPARWCSAVRIPPSGPSPGCRSGTVAAPVSASTAANARCRRRRRSPACIRQRRRPRPRRTIAAPSTSTNALSRPIRRLAPPVSTAAATGVVTSPDCRDAGRVELRHEQRDPLGLVDLADQRRHLSQAAQRTAGSRGWWAPTSARSPTRATRWHAGRRAHGGSRPGRRRSARSGRGRDRRGVAHASRYRGDDATTSLTRAWRTSSGAPIAWSSSWRARHRPAAAPCSAGRSC